MDQIDSSKGNKGALTGVIIGIAALILVALGFMAFGEQKEAMDGAMMEKEGAMMEGEGAMKDEGMMKEDGAMMEGDAMMQKGSYEPYAAEKVANAEGDVVLFFRATWCPTCRALDADIRSNAGSIPAGLTILDVNYDVETALKQKYGVTMQHTLVQVDAEGNLVKKWTGSPTLAALTEGVI